jgi:hypothetical protein
MPTTILPARVNPLLTHPSERRLRLDGAWRFALDPDDGGVAERWFRQPERFAETIQVPGSWQGQGFGGDGDDLVWDFQIRTRTFRATYAGTGWYARGFHVPEVWSHERLWLNFGGAHPNAEVWVNGEPVGAHDLPFVPFAFEVTPLIQPGENLVVVRVSEHHRLYGLAFNYQGNWSGLYRGVDLTATSGVYLRACRLYPDVQTERLRIVAEASTSRPGLMLRVAVTLAAGGDPVVAHEAPLPPDGIVDLPVPSPLLWSPDAPNLYRVDVALCENGEILDAVSERTGFVALSTAGKHVCLNGEPYYLRGSGDFLSCPETGCPDTDRERWRRKLRALRDYGYNYVRCQSYVYGSEYYDVADEVGLLVQSEMGMLGAWGGMSPMHVYQWPKPTPDHYPVLKRQWELTVQRDASHPSANLYCMSNEYGNGGAFHFPKIAWECYHATKALKPTAFVLWTDGGYRADLPGDFVNDEASRDAECALPVVQHEFRWWSSFPDVRLKGRYDGAVRPYAIEIAEQAAARQGLGHLLTRFADASQRLQLQEAKLKMESCRRDNPTLAGINHFDAMDANPSPQGVITEFYEHKLATSAEWQRTNGDTVLLAGVNADDRALAGGTTFRCTLAVSDFAHPPCQAPRVEWTLTRSEGTIAEGTLDYAHEAYRTCTAGEIAVALPSVTTPVALTLQATLRDGERVVENAWPLWLFPAETALPVGVARYGTADASWLGAWTELPVVESPRGMVLTDTLDDAMAAFLRDGGRAILAATEGMIRPHPPNFGYVNYYFTPPANYSPYEDGQNGTLVETHPLLGDFPHEGFADLHWFRMIDPAPPLDLAPLELTAGEPAVRVIHRYPVCHPLAYLHEVAVGRGRLILCALALQPEWPEARYLLAQLCAYAQAPTAPAPEIDAATFARLQAATALARVPTGHGVLS